MNCLLAALLLSATYTRALERVATLDPAMAQTAYDSQAVCLLYETPLAIDYLARPYRLIPGCCELPRYSEDGRVLTLKMRRPGKLTAADVVRSLERLRDPEVVSPNGWLVKDVDTMKALDEQTVEIRLRRRVRYFPWLLTISGSAVSLPDGSGTGPYRLVDWRKNHSMTMRLRDEPPKGFRGFDEIRYLVVDDMSTQWLMFLRGELDYIGEISRDNWDFIIGQDGRIDPALEARGVRFYASPAMTVSYIGFNMRDAVVGPNRKLRQALNCAFDFPSWKKFYNNRIVECNGAVPPGVEGRVEAPLPYRFDLGKARRLMVEAGYPDGIDPATGRRLVLTLAIGRASQESREAGELLASFFAKIGVKLELSFMTWDAFLKAVNEGRVQMYRMAWLGDYPDAQNFLQLFYGPNKSPGVNHCNYENAEYDAAYASEDFARCQEILREDCPWVFANFTMNHAMTGPRLGNFHQTDFPHGIERYFEVKESRR